MLVLVIGRQFTTKETVCVLMEDENKNSCSSPHGETNASYRRVCIAGWSRTAKPLLIGSVFQSMLELFGDEATTVETDQSTISVRNAKAGYRFTLMDTAKYPVPEPCTPDLLNGSQKLLRNWRESVAAAKRSVNSR